MLRFVGNRDQKNSPKIPAFFNAKFPGKHEKNIHKMFLGSRRSNNSNLDVVFPGKHDSESVQIVKHYR